MALEDVGVRFITEGERQFEATIKRADSAVDNFGKSATKNADQVQSKWSSMMKTLSSPEGLKFMMGAATAAAGALISVGVAVKKLADNFMTYAFQVKDFGRIIGATPEEASKLIQVADDVRLSVGSMTTAMRTAITKGYAPNIEGLGKMSDAYLSIQDPLDRSRYLVETFGRSGLEMAKLMELGSDKIKEMGDSIEGTGRLMTNQGIATAQAYYNALDNLGDAIAGASLNLGVKFTPAIINVANGLTGVVDDGIGVIDMFLAFQDAASVGAADLYDLQYALVDYMLVTRDAGEITEDFADKAQKARDAEWTFTDSLLRNPPAAKKSADAVEDLTEKLAKLTEAALNTSIEAGLSGTLTKGLQDYHKVLNDTAPKIFDLEKRLKFLDVNGWRPSVKSVDELSQKLRDQNEGMSKSEAARQAQIMLLASHNKQLGDTKQAIADLKAQQDAAAEAMKKATAEMIYQQAAAGLDADASLKLARAMGLISEKDYAVSSSIQNLKLSYDKNADGLISAAEGASQFADNIDLIYQAVSDLEMKNIPVTIDSIKTKIQELSKEKVEIQTPTIADIRALDETKPGELSKQLDAAATSVSTLGTAFSTNQTLMMSWSDGVKDVGINTKVAKDETGFLSEKMIGTGEAVLAHASEVSTWSGLIETLGTTTEETADYMTEVNQQIKNLPAQKTVDIYINVHGSVPNIDNYVPGPNPGKHASGGPTYANTLYLVGERGPELFIPDVSGTMIPNGPTMSILDNLITIIPMAKGGKMTKAQEKAQNKKARAQIERRASKVGMGLPGETGTASEADTILDRGNDVLDALKARETIAWDMVRSSVAEYNYLIKSGVSPGEMIDKKRMIDQSVQEAQALTKLRIESERQVTLMESQVDTAEGMENTSTWLGKLITQFKDFFDLLTSTAAQEALKTLNPLISASPAPLAVGLSQIGREMAGMSATSIPRFTESIAQLANPSRIYQNQSSTYNVNVPITATIRSDADMQTLAYQIAKIFVRETR